MNVNRGRSLLLLSSVLVGGIVYWYLFRPASIQVAKVAVVVPLTGEDAISGGELQAGVELLRMAVRRTELLPHDYRFVIDIHDDQSTQAGAQAAAYAVVSDPNVVAVVGHFSSANTLAGLPIYKNAGLPVIMPVATLTTITESGNFPNAFRLPPNNELQAQSVATFVSDKLAARHIFIIHDETEYARNLAFSIENSLRTRHIEPVGIAKIERGTQNFPILASLASFTPPIEAIIFVGYSPEGVYLARQLRLSTQLKAVLVCTDGVYGTRFRVSDGAEGAYVVYQVPPREKLDTRPQWAAYASAFSHRFTAMNPEGWAAWSYDGVGLAREALKESLQLRRAPSAAAILAVLRGTADSTPFEYAGVLGDYEFDKHGDNKHGFYYIYRVDQQKYVSQWSYGTAAAR